MRQLSRLSRIGTNAHRLPPSNVCVFCLHHQRLPFSTSASHPVDVKRKLQGEQTERQKKYAEANEVWLTPAQLAPRERHHRREAALQKEREWQSLQRDVRNNGGRLPPKHLWEEERAKALGLAEEPLTGLQEAENTKEEEALAEWQESFYKASDRTTVEAINPGYEEAQTWDGLPMVGGEVEWDTGERFKGFLPTTKHASNEQVTIAAYQAIVEVLTAVTRGWELTRLKAASRAQPSAINEAICAVRIKLESGTSSEGELQAIKLEFPSEQVEHAICRAISEDAGSQTGAISENAGPQTEAISEDETPQIEAIGDEAISQTEAISDEVISQIEAIEETHTQVMLAQLAELQAQIKEWGTDWHAVSIADPAIKLAVIKRITALTGKPIPDFTIHAHNTIGSLLTKLIQPPPPKTLHDTLQSDQALTSLPNVSLSKSRVREVNKETQIGRWKVIRQELRERGLLGEGENGLPEEFDRDLEEDLKEASKEMRP